MLFETLRHVLSALTAEMVPLKVGWRSAQDGGAAQPALPHLRNLLRSFFEMPPIGFTSALLQSYLVMYLRKNTYGHADTAAETAQSQSSVQASVHTTQELQLARSQLMVTGRRDPPPQALIHIGASEHEEKTSPARMIWFTISSCS